MFDANPPPASHALMQDRAFAAALRLCGEEPVMLSSGLLLLNRRILGLRVLMLPRALPPPDFYVQLGQAGLHRRPLILSPDAPHSVNGACEIAAPRCLFNLDLTPTKPARRARLHQNWRHQLGQAEQGPLRVLQRPMTADHPLLALDTAQSRKRRYRNWPGALTSAFVTVAPDQSQLFTAMLRGHPVAHMLILTHGSRATYHIGHTTQQGRSLHAHNLLLWEAMTVLAERGITTLDLGPTTTAQIDRFKRRTGAISQPTGGTWFRWTPFARRND
ncbi:GNAT family N-acetyltransferase [Sulfitobacter guttiformis]|uniref:Acetyltransferase (GNAT) family protein n=1 Tax=Sulfitobacter guttiformis TaxID=74349 RepID=A0A420DMT7_9RHOB|nr:GNAT family N-acetyltransferase [Sulfitobacter guttiformis]KIN72840.1 Acetyltransf 6 domain containing protein [Sulfitobacter guttiformis KCTC 32187]RKE95531.1 acetyltransferase (GNAT) family protein [Sulfitobacter guttiformis]